MYHQAMWLANIKSDQLVSIYTLETVQVTTLTLSSCIAYINLVVEITCWLTEHTTTNVFSFFSLKHFVSFTKMCEHFRT